MLGLKNSLIDLLKRNYLDKNILNNLLLQRPIAKDLHVYK